MCSESVYVYTYIGVGLCMSVCMYVLCMHASMYVCMRVCVGTYVCICMTHMSLTVGDIAKP